MKIQLLAQENCIFTVKLGGIGGNAFSLETWGDESSFCKCEICWFTWLSADEEYCSDFIVIKPGNRHMNRQS